MSLPSPPVALSGHCSAVYNGTLYTYQGRPPAFQSIPLQPGGTWSQLLPGFPVAGAACVLGRSAADGDQDALFIVGGTPSGARVPTPSDYADDLFPGVQRYLLHDRRWAFPAPANASVVRARLRHSAAALDAREAILVFGGMQGVNGSSSETFTLATDAALTMQSYTARGAPAVTDPILLPWNASHVVLAGGAGANERGLWLFAAGPGWQKLANVAMPVGIADTRTVQATLRREYGGRIVMQWFDLSVAPCRVATLAVNDADEQPGIAMMPPGSRAAVSPGSLQRRQSDGGAGLPPYNTQYAPGQPRSGFSLATDPASQLAVVSGGGTNGADAPIALFNQTANAWLDAQKFFGGAGASTPDTPNPTASSPNPGISATATDMPSAAPSAGGGSGPNVSSPVLGGVLGGLFGFLALLLALYLLIRYRRRRREAPSPESHGLHGKDFDVLSPSTAPGRSPFGRSAASSLGRSRASRAGSFPPQHNASATRDVPAVPPPPPAAAAAADKPHPPRADSGWSQYFVNPSLNSRGALHPTGPPRPASPAAQTQYTRSDYDGSAGSRPGSVAAARRSLERGHAPAPLHLPAGKLPPAAAVLAGAPGWHRLGGRGPAGRTPPSPGSDPENLLSANAGADRSVASWDPTAAAAAAGSGSSGAPAASAGAVGGGGGGGGDDARSQATDTTAPRTDSTGAAQPSSGSSSAGGGVRIADFPAVPSAASAAGRSGSGGRAWGLGNSWREVASPAEAARAGGVRRGSPTLNVGGMGLPRPQRAHVLQEQRLTRWPELAGDEGGVAVGQQQQQQAVGQQQQQQAEAGARGLRTLAGRELTGRGVPPSTSGVATLGSGAEGSSGLGEGGGGNEGPRTRFENMSWLHLGDEQGGGAR